MIDASSGKPSFVSLRGIRARTIVGSPYRYLSTRGVSTRPQQVATAQHWRRAIVSRLRYWREPCVALDLAPRYLAAHYFVPNGTCAVEGVAGKETSGPGSQNSERPGSVVEDPQAAVARRRVAPG